MKYYILTFIIIFVFLFVWIIPRLFSKLESIGKVEYSSLNEQIENLDVGGKFMLLTNKEASKHDIFSDLMNRSNNKEKDLLLIFDRKIKSNKSVIYLGGESGLKDTQYVSLNGISVYAISWRRIKIPPGIAVD